MCLSINGVGVRERVRVRVRGPPCKGLLGVSLLSDVQVSSRSWLQATPQHIPDNNSALEHKRSLCLAHAAVASAKVCFLASPYPLKQLCVPSLLSFPECRCEPGSRSGRCISPSLPRLHPHSLASPLPLPPHPVCLLPTPDPQPHPHPHSLSLPVYCLLRIASCYSPSSTASLLRYPLRVPISLVAYLGPTGIHPPASNSQPLLG